MIQRSRDGEIVHSKNTVIAENEKRKGRKKMKKKREGEAGR